MDLEYNCQVYVTLTNQDLCWTEPNKMSDWMTINTDQYQKLCERKRITPTHQKYYEEILTVIKDQITMRTLDGTDLIEEKFTPKPEKSYCTHYRKNSEHRHLVCRKCDQLRFGDKALYECYLQKDQSTKRNNNWRRPNENKAQDALFIEAKVNEEKVNAMLDTGSLSNVVSKALLDKLEIEIDRPAQSAMIDINGNRTVPLGIVTNLQIEIGDAKWIA